MTDETPPVVPSSETPAPATPALWDALRVAALPDRIAGICLALAAGGLLYGLARYWGANPGYADRFLVLLASGWAAVQTWPHLAAIPRKPRPILGFPLLMLGILAIPLAWYLQARTGAATLLMWWQLLALILAMSGWLLMRQGYGRWRALWFALVFPLFALPIPGLIQRPLQAQLQDVTTTCAHFALSTAGMTVQRSGVVLQMASGDLGVAEACSGIRSLTALTALAAFIAYLRGFGPIRGVSLVLLSVPVVVAVNIFRVTLTGFIQEFAGADYVRDDWHEALGFAMVLLGLGLILGVASWLGESAPATRPGEPAPETHVGATSGWLAAGLLVAMVAGSGAAISLSQSVAEKGLSSAPLEEIPLTLPNWNGTSQKIQPGIAEMLNYDTAIYRTYRNNIGQEVHVWVVYWPSATASRGYHHPDVCWPSRGFTVTNRRVEPIPMKGGGTLPASAWDFERKRDRQFVLCWTQDGNTIRSADEDRSTVMRLGGQAWVQDLLGMSDDSEAQPRLMVLIGDPHGTPATKRATLEFAEKLLPELYKICPWGDPSATSTHPRD